VEAEAEVEAAETAPAGKAAAPEVTALPSQNPKPQTLNPKPETLDPKH
jgi:hypothetical protein